MKSSSPLTPPTAATTKKLNKNILIQTAERFGGQGEMNQMRARRAASRWGRKETFGRTWGGGGPLPRSGRVPSIKKRLQRYRNQSTKLLLAIQERKKISFF